MSRSDHGMTLLEVVFAITILLMGAGFMAKSNAVTFKYRDQSTEYKQMLFYTAGQMDAIIEYQNVSEDVNSPFKSFEEYSYPPVNVGGLEDYLQKVGVKVSVPGRSPIIIYSYRLR